MDDGTTVSALRHCQRPPDLDELMNTAADRIAALEAENERLRAALAPMTKGLFWLNGSHVATARAALQENDNA